LEDNTKLELKEMGYEGGYWIQLVGNRVQRERVFAR